MLGLMARSGLKRRWLPLLVVASTLAVLTGCGSSEPPGGHLPDAGLPGGDNPDGGSGGGSPDAGPTDGGGVPGRTLTWYRDVLPIVQAQCQECHTAGGIAPFSLGTYAEARQMH